LDKIKLGLAFSAAFFEVSDLWCGRLRGNCGCGFILSKHLFLSPFVGESEAT